VKSFMRIVDMLDWMLVNAFQTLFSVYHKIGACEYNLSNDRKAILSLESGLNMFNDWVCAIVDIGTRLERRGVF